jgi:P27 family predicted phage terminase small subunit
MLFELHGKPSHGRKANPAEPKPPGELSDAPDWFSPSQKAGWDYVMRCAPPGLLKQLDRSVLTVWVVAEDLHRQAVIGQNKIGGLVSKLKDTQFFVISPYLSIISQQAKVMLKAGAELGFSPSSRSGISPGGGNHLPGDSTDALDDFLRSDPDWKPTIN